MRHWYSSAAVPLFTLTLILAGCGKSAEREEVAGSPSAIAPSAPASREAAASGPATGNIDPRVAEEVAKLRKATEAAAAAATNPPRPAAFNSRTESMIEQAGKLLRSGKAAEALQNLNALAAMPLSSDEQTRVEVLREEAARLVLRSPGPGRTQK
jgi:hypothetical protein